MSTKDINEQNKILWTNMNMNQNLKYIKERSITEVLMKYLDKNDKILDAGCGLGAWVYYLISNGYQNTIGIDINPDIIKMAKKFNINLYNDDIVNTHFSDNYFDKYISLGVVEHDESGPVKALKEAYRIMKPRGVAFISTPCNNLLRVLINHPIRDLINIVNRLSGKELYFSEYRFWKSELIQYIKNAGFKIMKVVPNDFNIKKSNFSYGLYTDWPILRHASEKYRLNWLGIIIHKFLKMVSISLVISGYLIIATKDN